MAQSPCLSGGYGTFNLGEEAVGPCWGGAFSRNNYRSPTTNYTMQVFGSDA